MRFTAAIVAIAIAATAVVLGDGGNVRPADASFHQMRVQSVMAGFDGDEGVQYVELRMASGGQTQVGGRVLCFFNFDGAPLARFKFPANVTGGTNGSSILVGSPEMDAAWLHSPDVVFSAANTTAIAAGWSTTAPVPFTVGKVAFGSDPATDSAAMCGAGFSLVDSVAYGGLAYAATPDFGTPFPGHLEPDSALAVRLTGPLCNPCARDNSVDYSGVDANSTANVPHNNSGQFGPLGPVMGDFDCDGDVQADDGLAALGDAASLGSPICNARTDINCDQNHGVDDALDVFRDVADLPRLTTAPVGCAEIGDPTVHAVFA